MSTFFYDNEYNTVFKEPVLKNAGHIHLIDKDLMLVAFTHSVKVVIYNRTTKEIVKKAMLKTFDCNPNGTAYIEGAVYLKEQDKIIYACKSGWGSRTEEELREKSGVVFYEYDFNAKKKCSEIYRHSGRMQIILSFLAGGKAYVLTDNNLLFAIDNNLAVEVIEVDRKLRLRNKRETISPIVYFDYQKNIIFSANTHNPVSYNFYKIRGFHESLTISLDGSVEILPRYDERVEKLIKYLLNDEKFVKQLAKAKLDEEEYQRKYKDKPRVTGMESFVGMLGGIVKKASGENAEEDFYKNGEMTQMMDEYARDCYVADNGVDKYALDNYDDDEILEGGFSWARDKLAGLMKGVDLTEFEFIKALGGKLEKEHVLLAIGWFFIENQEGGYSQYFKNSFGYDDPLCLIAALKIVGADKTVEFVEKCLKLAEKKRFAEMDDLGLDIGEDYVEKTIAYFRNKILGQDI